MTVIISAKEIRDQLQKIIRYFVFDETAKPKLKIIMSKIPDSQNVDEYAQKYEDETDDFIHKISELMELEREDTLKEVSKVSEQVLAAFTIRLVTLDDLLLKNPDKMLPVSGENPQFLCDCLINFWRLYQKNGDINLFKV